MVWMILSIHILVSRPQGLALLSHLWSFSVSIWRSPGVETPADVCQLPALRAVTAVVIGRVVEGSNIHVLDY